MDARLSRAGRAVAAATVLAVTSALSTAPAGAAPSVAAASAAAPAGYSVVGVDVSNHQGTINWAQLAASGQAFSYAKATEGVQFTDPYFAANNSGAKANGLYAGAYHYARPDRSSGKAQADYFLDRAQYLNDGRTLPPMLDVEWPWDGSGSPYPCYGLTPDQMVSWVHDFVNEIRARTGRPTMIYTNVNWWNPCTNSNPTFGDQPLFVARYASTPGTLPAGWATFAAWQYTSSATMPGVNGPVDQDVFNGSLADLTRLAGGLTPRMLGDFNGDGRDEAAVWRPSTGTWWVAYSGGGFAATVWGEPGDLPLVGNIGGDQRDDFIVWRPTTATWWVAYAGGGGLTGLPWGAPGDVPLVGDIDGDKLDDIVVWRPSTGVWQIRFTCGGTASVAWGQPGDVPLLADFNGDGRDDFVIWRPSTATWWVRYSDNSGYIANLQWGLPTDVPLAGNVGGDGRADFIVWRPSDGTWWVRNTGGGSTLVQWGQPGDLPLLGRVGGDGHDDYVIWRPAGATWWVRYSDGTGFVSAYPWGVSTDVPL